MSEPLNPNDPPKWGEEGAVLLTIFHQKPVGGIMTPQYPTYELVAQRFTIADHPDYEDRPNIYLRELASDGEVRAGSTYLVVRDEWKQYNTFGGGSEPMLYTETDRYTTRVELDHS